jgi:hypothetical protein
MVFVGEPYKGYVQTGWRIFYVGQYVFVQPIRFPDLAFDPVSVHGMPEASFGNRNEDADARFLGMSVHNAYRICRQGLAVSSGEEGIDCLFATKPLRFLQAKAIIHYAVSNMHPGLQ